MGRRKADHTSGRRGSRFALACGTGGLIVVSALGIVHAPSPASADEIATASAEGREASAPARARRVASPYLFFRPGMPRSSVPPAADVAGGAPMPAARGGGAALGSPRDPAGPARQVAPFLFFRPGGRIEAPSAVAAAPRPGDAGHPPLIFFRPGRAGVVSTLPPLPGPVANGEARGPRHAPAAPGRRRLPYLIFQPRRPAEAPKDGMAFPSSLLATLGRPTGDEAVDSPPSPAPVPPKAEEDRRPIPAPALPPGPPTYQVVLANEVEPTSIAPLSAEADAPEGERLPGPAPAASIVEEPDPVVDAPPAAQAYAAPPRELTPTAFASAGRGPSRDPAAPKSGPPGPDSLQLTGASAKDLDGTVMPHHPD